MTGHVTEERVYAAFSSLVQKLINQKPEVLAACEEVLTELMNTQGLDTREAKLRVEHDRIIAQADALNEQASHSLIRDYGDQFAALEAKLARTEEKLRDVAAERSDREYKTRQCRLYLSKLRGLSLPANRDDDVGSDTETFMALVDKVIVGDDFMFILKDGSMWTSPLRKTTPDERDQLDQGGQVMGAAV